MSSVISALLQPRAADAAPRAATTRPDDPAAPQGHWPLSDAQRVVWLDMRLRAHPLAYQLGGQARVDGPLDTQVFGAAVAQVMARHDALRLRVDATEPRQTLARADDTTPPLRWHALDGDERAAAAGAQDRFEALSRHIHAQPLGLDGGPLFAIDAVRLRHDRWVLIWRCSHLIADGYSVWRKVRAIAAAYNQRLAPDSTATSTATSTPPDGGADDLLARSSFVATLPIAAAASGAHREADRAHWRERLAGLPDAVFEPGKPAATATQGVQAVQAVQWRLAGADYLRWNAACARDGVSPHRALLALLALAVGTRCDREDLIVGLALHGRTRATRDVVGMFSGVLPVRCSWTVAEDRLVDVVQRSARALERDYRHRRLPVDEIARSLGRAAQGRARLFDVSLSYLPVDADAVRLSFGNAPARIDRQYPGAIVPLPLDVMDNAREQVLELSLGHDPSFLDATRAQALAQCLQRTMAAYVDDGNQPVKRLSPVSDAEWWRLVNDFQPAWRTDIPLQRPLQALVREQVRRQPEAVAVEDGARSLSYATLDRLSDQLAARLRALWPARVSEPVAAVALPRSAETVVALLAILKAGGVYLPLDIAHPLPRLRYMLDDARAAVLIDALNLGALGGLADERCRRPSLPDVQHVARLDATALDASLDRPTAGDDAGFDTRRLAYLIYTSGSTGQPKPVGVPHRAAVNLAFARQDHDPLGPGDKVLAAISVGFDVSIGQLLLPLLSGATIVVAPPLQGLEPEAFWALLARHGVSHINSVPSFFDTVSEALAARPEHQRYRGLRRLMLGGEVLTGALARKLQQRLPGTGIVNMYGPTETCIDATAYPVPDASSGELPASLPIGRPLPNYRAYVLDRHGRLLPPGDVGELCIGGAGVARGYVGRDGLTAEKFGDDPHADPAQGPSDRRLYRSGDLARWRVDGADGQIEFLGRNDQQVKIRGHRIETGEIEAQLLRHAGVAQAAVLALPDARGELQLAAYLVAAADAPANTPDLTLLRLWLATELPSHMRPASLQTVAALPLTPNGKLDRKALPAPQFDAAARAAGQAADRVPPQGALETLIASLWAELLGLAADAANPVPVGRDDNFFDLGGHSLLALRLVERLRQAGWQAEVSTLFATPTVQALAAACRPLEDTAGDAQQTAATPAAIPPGCTRITPGLLPGLDLSQDQIDTLVAQGPGRHDAVQDIYPLSPLQQGMLYHHLMQAEGDVFISPFIVSFAQAPALQAFLAALRQVVARHDILRTSIAWDGLAEPLQVVWRNASLPLQDLGSASAGQALAQLQQHVDPRHLRLDLRRAPLLRTVVLHEQASADGAQPARHLLALVLHHLALDHAALETVLAEVAALVHDAQAPLPVPQPFRDRVWQARLAQADGAAQRYFSEQLADVDQPTTPFGLATLPGEHDEVAEHTLALAPGLVTQLRQRAAQAGVSLASLLHLAYGLVLARTGGRDDVVLGTVLLGRLGQQGDLGHGGQAALGMAINTLPLRLRLDRMGTLHEALQATQSALAGLMRHEHTPLALAQRCSAVEAPAPLFTALFNVRHGLASGAGSPTAALGMDVVWVHERTGYPLALAVDDLGDRLRLCAQAMAPVDPAQVTALMAQALQALLAPLDSALAQADVLPPAQRHTLLHGFQSATAPLPTQGLHNRVRAQVQRTPDAVAVVDGELQLSYAQLDARSDALAAQLRAALAQCAPGVAEPVVAVGLPRSAATVVALLAILKAGAVYLPLDIAYPARRLQYMLDDAQARLLLDEPAQSATAALRACRLSDVQATAPRPPAPPEPADDPQRLAYVIYTSGSTGQPKAVAVPHVAAANLAWARQGHDPTGPGDRVLAAISVGFDVSIGQLLLPLLSGATIVIAPPLQGLGPEAFWALLARHGVSHINSVPSFFDAVSEALVQQPPEARYRGLRRLMLGGEVLTGALARKLQQRLPGTGIVNMYGPTEACIDATAYPVPDASSDDLPAALPIGRPLPNYRAYVVDARGRLAPVGVAGELCLAGAGLARGYLGRPEATAEKFVADPFADGSPFQGGRMYRTGDLARWRADGQIEFLGRDDQQVKIRGHRVETGEIESALLQHTSIAQAAVLPCRDGDRPGWACLAAYLVAAPGASGQRPDDATLRQRLAATLPEHMLPQAWIWLDSLPITPNGKLDRKALPAPAQRSAAERGQQAVQAPRNALEARLLAVWQDVFGRSDFGVGDDFFALGGHSLLAMRLLTACQAALREPDAQPSWREAASRLVLRQLLQSPTVAGLAALIDADPAVPASANAPALPLVALRASGQRAPLFCIHPQGGHVLCFAELARQLPADVPVYGLQAPGLEAGEVPLDDIAALAAHHLAAIQHWRARTGTQAQALQLLGYSAGGVIAQEMARQLLAGGQAVDLLVLLDAPAPGSAALRAPRDRAALQREAERALQALAAQPAGSADAAVAQDVHEAQAATLHRMQATAQAMDLALRHHVAQPLALDLHLVQALQPGSDGPGLVDAADWQPLLAAPARLATLAIDSDHQHLLDAAPAQRIAQWLVPMLATAD